MMRLVWSSLVLLCTMGSAPASVLPWGGDPIGPDSRATDGQGATPAMRIGALENYRGQPGVAFSVEGGQKLAMLRSVVTFLPEPGGRVVVPNHEFHIRLWTLDNYLARGPHLLDIELGPPVGVTYKMRPGGSVVPKQAFGAAGGNLPPDVPSYDFRWDLTVHSAFGSPMPAGHYVLALYAVADAKADGEAFIGISQEPAGLEPVNFSNAACCEFGPGFLDSACCPKNWAIALYVEEEPAIAEEPAGEPTSLPFVAFDGLAAGESLPGFAPFLLGSFSSFSAGPIGGGSGGGGGFDGSGGGGGVPLGGFAGSGDLFQSGTSTSFMMNPRLDPPDFEFPPDIPPGEDVPTAEITPVPEPSSLVLLILGGSILAARRYFRSRLP